MLTGKTEKRIYRPFQKVPVPPQIFVVAAVSVHAVAVDAVSIAASLATLAVVGVAVVADVLFLVK